MTNVVIPVKELTKAKGRLRSVLRPDERAGLVLTMLHDLLTSLCHCDLGNIWLVASDDVVLDLGAQFGATSIRETASQGYNSAVSTGLMAVADRRPVIVLPADLPLIEPSDIERLIDQSNIGFPSVGIVPDRHNQGTNGLFLSTPDLIVPSFGDGSFSAHKRAANQADATATIVPLANMALDIDCADDLSALAQSGHTGATVDFLKSISFADSNDNQRNRGVA